MPSVRRKLFFKHGLKMEVGDVVLAGLFINDGTNCIRIKGQIRPISENNRIKSHMTL
jgi:hypothetical protein